MRFPLLFLPLTLLLLPARPATACGGLFCNTQQPVVQSGEHIVFAVDPEAETVRAIINIEYTGEAPDFAWILPLQSAPSLIQVGPSSLFGTIDRLIGPQFIVTRESDVGQCPVPPAQFVDAGAASDSGVGAGVTVLGQQTVGPYESVVLSSTDPEATRSWLSGNGYNVTDEMIRLVVPYLQKGDVLLALKLRNGQDVRNIQPIDLTMAGTLACVPMRLTAIAALDNLELRITMLSQSGRAIPSNYFHLDLNFGALNWRNPSASYSGLVARAADEAGGNAFVTEYAGSSDVFEGQIAGNYRRSDLEAVETVDVYLNALQSQGLLRRDVVALVADYISDEVYAAVGSSKADFVAGRAPGFLFTDQPIDAVGVTAAIWAAVVEPEQSAQALFDAFPRVTRLYTLLSPEEMTIDPELTVRSDLPDVSNVHRATAHQVCQGDSILYQVTLEGSGQVLSYDNAGATLSWQSELPAARRIVQLWDDQLVADRSAAIDGAFAARTATPSPSSGLARDSASRGDCSCRSTEGAGGLLAVGVLGLLLLGRRRS